MFIGHFAVALAAKRAAPRISLGTLFAAAQLADLLWPLFLLLGLEHVRIDPGNTAFTPLDFYDYPITHSFLGSLGWAVAFGLCYVALKKDRKSSLIVSGAVLSHWILDVLTHRPDLPLAPGSRLFFGLGLWNSPVVSVIVELCLFAAGIALYLCATRASDRIGIYAFWSLIGFLIMIWGGNILGPPPPSVEAIAVLGNSMWLLVLWAFWADRHRKSVDALNPG